MAHATQLWSITIKRDDQLDMMKEENDDYMGKRIGELNSYHHQVQTRPWRMQAWISGTFLWAKPHFLINKQFFAFSRFSFQQSLIVVDNTFWTYSMKKMCTKYHYFIWSELYKELCCEEVFVFRQARGQGHKKYLISDKTSFQKLSGIILW